MKIEGITASKKTGEIVYLTLEDGKLVRIMSSAVADFGLYAGLELSEERLQEILQHSGTISAKRRAARIVSCTDISERNLRDRLIQRGEDAAAAEEAVAWLRDMGALNDVHLAEEIRESCIRKGYGVNRVRQELYQKGVPEACWDTALRDYPDLAEEIDRFLEKQFRGEAPDRREIRRASEALVRRGHDWESVRSGIRRYLDEKGSAAEAEDWD